MYKKKLFRIFYDNYVINEFQQVLLSFIIINNTKASNHIDLKA